VLADWKKCSFDAMVRERAKTFGVFRGHPGTMCFYDVVAISLPRRERQSLTGQALLALKQSSVAMRQLVYDTASVFSCGCHCSFLSLF
jgi:hypothetical protein